MTTQSGDDRFRHVRRVIVRRVLLLPFLLLLAVCGTLVWYFAVYSRQQVEIRLAEIAAGHSRIIERFLEERTADLVFAASREDFDELSRPGGIAPLLADLRRKSDAFFDLGVFNAAGDHLAYAGPYDLAGKNYAGADWFTAVGREGTYVSEMFLGKRGSPHFVIAVRRAEAGRIWYLRATIDTDAFRQLVEGVRMGKTGEAYLVNRRGMFQTRPRSGRELMTADPEYGRYSLADDAMTSFTARDTAGRAFLYNASPLHRTNWILIVRQEMRDACRTLGEAVAVAMAMIAVGGTVVAIMAYLLASRISGQLALADQEQRETRRQLVAAGKLVELGEMSAGVAHEINNPLQIMKSEQTLMEDLISELRAGGEDGKSENLSTLEDSVSQIGVQIDRCKSITQGLLKFARQGGGQKQVIHVEQYLPEMVALVERQAKLENIRIVQRIAPDLPPIAGDPGQLQQVLLNLLNNAIWASKGRSEAEIEVRAFPENGGVILSVEDHGQGIAPEDLEKVFLPFFTTKPVGQGTGLGLSTAYGIVQSMGGEMSVASAPGSGSLFTVRLPVCESLEPVVTEGGH
jgi:two-component system NtrC family sensor kinase